MLAAGPDAALQYGPRNGRRMIRLGNTELISLAGDGIDPRSAA